LRLEAIELGPRRTRTLKLDPAFFRIRRLLDRYHLPLHLSKLGRRLLVSATKKAAGKKMTIAAAVATPSLVRCLSCSPDSVCGPG